MSVGAWAATTAAQRRLQFNLPEPVQSKPLDRQAMNDAIDALLAAGRQFSWKDLPQFPKTEISLRMSKLVTRGEALIAHPGTPNAAGDPRRWKAGKPRNKSKAFRG